MKSHCLKKLLHPKTVLTKVCITLLAIMIAIAFFVVRLYKRKPLTLVPDAAYLWPVLSQAEGIWKYEKLATGHAYYLYLPETLRQDKDNEDAHIPLIVAFHGSYDTGSAVSKMGRRFTEPEFQKRIHPMGAAVLVPLGRIGYFSDPHSMNLLIQNIILKNKCIDKANIIGYGFSQGAKYVVELACYEPRLFKGVISGSGFYQITYRELLSVLPISFYSALSENDRGIFEQGVKTGRLCGTWCRNSRYVQYPSRYHFWVELYDKTGRGEETMEDWLISVAQQ